MTENDFLRMVAGKAGYTFQDTEVFFKAFIEAVNECVEKRESFLIQNFGVLSFGKVKERTVHSKLLGDNVFPETEKVYLHLSNNLKQVLKNSKK